MAIEKGAEQAATGFWPSGIIGVLSILLVGSGLAISTLRRTDVKNRSRNFALQPMAQSFRI